MLGSRSFASAADMSPPPTTKHDVFLSFRGEDTRDNFISHLNAELGRKKIETFMDHRLARGEEISPALCKAIEESMIYVVILSENYASSTWCLDELTKILECRDRYGRDVIPIFYKVDPSDVRNQRQSYAEAFVKHQRRFNDDQVDAWKAALTQVAGLSGWDSQVTRPEHTLIEEIVKDVSRKLNLNHSFLNDYQGMIGIDKHIEQLQSLLHLESEDVRVVGIWGMGGIGKTTIARAIYHKLATKFSSRSIILNVRQEVERAGVHHMQSKYTSELLEEDSTSSCDRSLERTKALLVLDDVSHSNQLKDLIGICSNFGKGSRIIVTSRDMQVLKNAEASGIYEVKEMSLKDSLQLFSLNAFKQNYPIEPYVDLSRKVLNYAKGVPLALEVLGSLLYSRTEEAWENLLQKLKKLPNDNIFKMLKLSYEGLDEEEKDIFLDIACFYRGHSENVVALTLDSCGFSAHIGMETLKDRGLISILKGRIVMHDLIQEMGHEIVRQECIEDPGKRSRLWKHEDIYKVLRNNKGTDAIRCIFLNLWRIEKVQVHTETFKKMDNLRTMLFYNPYGFSLKSNVILTACLESLPDDLKFLCWDSFPQKSFPQDFPPKNLVKLDMPRSHLEQLWQGDKYLPNLKTLDLRGSQSLIQIDLGQCPNIEEVILSHCTMLGKVYSSSFLRKLKCLLLNCCISLKSLQIPSNILLTASGIIVAHGCRNLEMFSVGNVKMGVQLHSRSIYQNAQSSSRYEKFSTSFDPYCCLEQDKEPKDNMQLLQRLVLLRQGSPSLFPSLNELCWLDLSYCDFLSSLPTEIFKLKFLKRLYLNNCLNLEKFGEIKGSIESLTVLVLDRTAIKELPPSLHHLVGLEELSLHGCRELKIIPSSIGSLGKLSKLNLTYCESLETFPSSIFKLKLTKLDLQGCTMLKTFPDILEPAETFVHIDLSFTAIKDLPPSLHHLVGLEELSLRGCRELKIIPSSIGSLGKLSKLNLTYCESLETFPSSIFKWKLTKLDLEGCSMLKTFPDILEPAETFVHIDLSKTAIKELPSSLHHLVGLERLSLRGCRELEIIPSSIGSLGKLSMLDITCCESLETFPSSIFKLKLTKLDLQGCSMLKTFPDILEPAETFVHINLSNTTIKELPSSLHHLVGLEELSLHGCRELKIIPSSIGSLGKLSMLDITCCESLETFPSSIFKLKLTKLDLQGCSMLKTFPDILEPAETFVHINLSKTAIKELPSSLHHLVGLEKLSLRGCRELEIIPSSIGSLGKLSKLNLTYCESLKTFPSSIFKLKLTKLDLQGCSMLKTFPDILEPAETFVHINLSKTAIKELPSSLHHLVGLEELSLHGCRELKIIPSSIGSLGKLSKLNLTYCESLETFPSSIFKLKLTKIDLQGCSMLKTFPDILEPAETFVHIDLSFTAIKELPSSLHHLVGLEELSLHGCRELKIIPSSIGSLGKLSKLNLTYCESLETFPSSIFKLKLTKLDLEGCSMLKTFPDILEPAETFVHIDLSNTAIKDLPSSLHHLVGLERLSLCDCQELEIIPSSIGSLGKLSMLDITCCESLETFPSSIFKLKLTKLDLQGCSTLKTFPDILEPAETFVHINLSNTAIKELPPSLHHLVGLEKLSLRYCRELEIIPSSIGSLGKLSKLNLTYCESLETFPSSIFKLKLTKLDLQGCSMLKTFPDILEPAETFVHINLSNTTIKELPSSMEYLVRLQTLCLNMCSNLVSLPNSIGNLNYLSELDCSGCCSIVKLPESIAHLSSLKSLDLSDCKSLECIPQLPPSLNQLFAYDCPSVGRMMPNSRLELPSDGRMMPNSRLELPSNSVGRMMPNSWLELPSNSGKDDTFEFHFTNNQERDETACSNIGAEAWLRITEDAYRSVFFCFPGSAVPGWFPYRCTGHLVTMKRDSQDLLSNNRLVGFALSVVLGRVEMDNIPAPAPAPAPPHGIASFTYRLTYESDGCTHILPNNDKIRSRFFWDGWRPVIQDHTFIWKYHLDFASIGNKLLDAHNFTFRFIKEEDEDQSSVIVKKCGVCPLYTKEKDDNRGNDNNGSLLLQISP